MALPPGYPVSACQSPTDAAFQPWLSWTGSPSSNMKKRSHGAVRMRWGRSCSNMVEATGDLGTANTPEHAWKLIPKNEQYDGRVCFAMSNAAYGDLNFGVRTTATVIARDSLTMGTKNSPDGGYTLPVTITGFTFDGVTPSNPDLWIKSNGSFVDHKMYVIASWYDQDSFTHYNNQTLPLNYFNKRDVCNSMYRAGAQFPNDPNDECIVQFGLIDAQQESNFVIMNPYFGSGTLGEKVGRCVSTVCSDKLSNSQSCRDFVTQNPGDSTIVTMLDKYCTQAANRSIDDPLCGIWCRSGLDGNQAIKQKCIDTRKAACSVYYDPATQSWKPGTSESAISRCACYMPDEFYRKLLNGATIPNGTTPNCFYKNCYESSYGAQSYTSAGCGSVQVCVQSNGGVTTTNCPGVGTQPGPPPVRDPPGPPTRPPPVNPPTNPPVTPPINPPVIIPPSQPVYSGYGWLWFILALVVTIIIVALIVYGVRRRNARIKREKDELLVRELLSV